MEFNLKFKQSLTPFTRIERFHRKVVIFDGEAILYLKNTGQIVKSDRLDPEFFKNSQVLVLLAAPYVFSYVHETAILTKSELSRADNFKLGSSRFGNNPKIIESIRIDKDKSLTIHSHFSNEGLELLTSLKTEKFKVKVEPFIGRIIRNILKQDLEFWNFGRQLSIVMSKQVLQIEKLSERLYFKHLYLWKQGGTFKEKINTAVDLLSNHAIREKEETHVDFSGSDEVITESVFRYLLFPKNATRPLQYYRFNTDKNLKKLIKSVSLVYVMLFFLVATGAWWLHSHSQLMDLREQRSQKLSEVKRLEQSVKQLQNLAVSERTLTEFEVLKKTVASNQLKPDYVLYQLDRKIPQASWIKSLLILQDSIKLEMYDYKESDIGKLIESFEVIFEDISLEENRVEKVKDTYIKAYTLKMKLKPNDEIDSQTH